MIGFGDRLKNERRRLNITQEELASLAGSSEPSQRRYERGIGVPNAQYLERIASLGVDIMYVLTGKRAIDALAPEDLEQARGEPMAQVGDNILTLIPLYDAQGAAGTGILNKDAPPADYLAFSGTWLARQGLRAKSAFLMTVAGTSMKPTLHDGDLIMVDRDRCTPVSRHIYVFTDPDTGGTRIKRIELAQGGLTIRSDNPAGDAPLLELHTADTADAVLQSILGEVVWVGHKLDRKGG